MLLHDLYKGTYVYMYVYNYNAPYLSRLLYFKATQVPLWTKRNKSGTIAIFYSTSVFNPPVTLNLLYSYELVLVTWHQGNVASARTLLFHYYKY